MCTYNYVYVHVHADVDVDVYSMYMHMYMYMSICLYVYVYLYVCVYVRPRIYAHTYVISSGHGRKVQLREEQTSADPPDCAEQDLSAHFVAEEEISSPHPIP